MEGSTYLVSPSPVCPYSLRRGKHVFQMF